jgi:glycosyltransferase involved in cell wall biosynthesis
MVVHGCYPHDVRVSREARVALASNWEVDVVASRGVGEMAHETVDGVRIYRLPIEHRRGRGVVAATLEYVAFAILAVLMVARLSTRRRYGVIHIHNPPDFLISAALLPKLLGARVILDIHDFSTEMFQMRFRRKKGTNIAIRMLLGVERFACCVADVVVTVHDQYRQELIARGIPERKVVVVMNSLDSTLLPPAEEPTANGVARIVYHGTVTPRYGLDQLVRAAALLERALVEIYGAGDSVAPLGELADVLRVADRVILTGTYLPQREVLRRVSSATAGVICTSLPSDEDLGLPTKLFEYICLRVPVVCADMRIVREHFSEGEVLFFRSGDVEALAAAVQTVIDDPTSAKRRSEAAFQRYEREYAWSINSRRYAALLEQFSVSGSQTQRGRDAVRELQVDAPLKGSPTEADLSRASEGVIPQ